MNFSFRLLSMCFFAKCSGKCHHKKKIKPEEKSVPEERRRQIKKKKKNLRNHFSLFISTISAFIRAKVCIVFSLFVFRDKANRADFKAIKPEHLFFLRVGGKDLQHINKLVKLWEEGNGRVLTVIEGMENLFGDQDKKPKRVHGLLVLH